MCISVAKNGNNLIKEKIVIYKGGKNEKK